MFTTRVWKLTSFAAVIAVATASFGDDERAQKLLTKSLFGDYHTNIVTVIKQRSEDKGVVVVKIERSRDGKTHESILSPLHMQGEYLNDGKTFQTYLPDEKVLIIQPTNPTEQDAKFRLPLIQRNYTLKSEKGREVAGRSCVVVTASPRYPQMPSIRYYFDEKTGFPLSKESISTDGTTQSEFEVVDIKFPAKLDSSIFRIDPVVGVEVVNYAEPKCVSGTSDAAQELGFTPIIPSRMPYGFQVQKMTVASERGVKILCLKLTDGLQKVTVSEWPYVPGEKIKTGEASSYHVRRGIRITVITDSGPELREAFLKPFLARVDHDNPGMVTSIGFLRNSQPN